MVKIKLILASFCLICTSQQIQISESEDLDQLIDKYDSQDAEAAPTDNDMVQETELLDADIGTEEEGDYQTKLFEKYSEDEIGDDGLSTNQKLINKENCKQFA